MVWGTGAINISTWFDGRTGAPGDEEYFEDGFPDTPFGGGQQGGEVSVIGEEEEETSNDTSQPFPLPPDVFAEVTNISILIIPC